jgi:hypothetical protein
MIILKQEKDDIFLQLRLNAALAKYYLLAI